MKTSYRDCPVCTSASVSLLHHIRFALPEEHPLPPEYDIVECETCGFVFADTRGTAADYDRYYAKYSKYADQATSTGGGGNPRDKLRLKETAEAIAKHVPNMEASIVDIGCANGGLLGALKALGYRRLFGIDPSPTCVENTRSIFGVAAAQGWLMELPEVTPRADLVIVSHVLEHVLDLRGALAHVVEILVPNALVYAEVPDAHRYTEFLAAPFQDFNTEHINHFGSSGLENLFLSSGLGAVEIGTKTIEAAQSIGYPALYGFFRRNQRPQECLGWRLDPAFHASMVEYVTKSQEGLDHINARLASAHTGPVIVWGTGQLALKLLAETVLATANVAIFVDGNPVNQGKKLRGVDIVSPETLLSLPPYPIIIATTLHHVAICDRIRFLGLPNPVITLV